MILLGWNCSTIVRVTEAIVSWLIIGALCLVFQRMALFLSPFPSLPQDSGMLPPNPQLLFQRHAVDLLSGFSPPPMLHLTAITGLHLHTLSPVTAYSMDRGFSIRSYNHLVGKGSQAKAKTSNGTVRTGWPAPCTSRRIFSVVSRENVASPHRSQT